MNKELILREMTLNIDVINEAVFNTIINFDIRDINDLYNIRRFTEIINNHSKSIRSTKYKTKINNEKVKSYVKDFLGKLNINYKEEFEYIKDNITYSKTLDNSLFKNETRQIYLLNNNLFSDIYDLTHEFTHFLALPNKSMNDTSYLFGEATSLFSEFILEDYLLSKRNLGEYKIENIRKLNSIYINNQIVDVQLKLIETFLDNGGIFKEDIESIFKNYNYSDICIIKDSLFDVIEKYECLDIDESLRYSVGYVVACYMYDRIKIYGYKEFMELVENMDNYEIDEFLNYLDLELEDTIYLRLTDKSYQKLEESFKKKIKRIG